MYIDGLVLASWDEDEADRELDERAAAKQERLADELDDRLRAELDAVMAVGHRAYLAEMRAKQGGPA
jgi:hypothetical protein